MIEAAARDAFRPTANPTFFWRHGQYARAVDALRAAVLAGEHFAVLTGDAGTGKTALVNALAQSLCDDGVFVGRLMYGRVEADEMWSALAHAFRLNGLESRDAFATGARAALCTVCAGARAVVLIVDEAQTFAPGALVELERLARVLSPGDRPVLSALLVGMPGLSAHLESAECAGLGERIGTRVELVELSTAEVASYIRYRLETACANPELLPADVVGRIATMSGGNPALINKMCHAVIAGFEGMLEPVTAPPPTVPRGPFHRGRRRWPLARIGLVVAGVAGLGMAIFAGVQYRTAVPPPAAVRAPAEPVAAPADVAPPPAVEQPMPSPVAAQRSTAPSGPVATPEGVPGRLPRTTRATTPAVNSAPAPSAPPQRAVTKPQRQDDQPDPTDVIDWLLKDRSGRR